MTKEEIYGVLDSIDSGNESNILKYIEDENIKAKVCRLISSSASISDVESDEIIRELMEHITNRIRERWSMGRISRNRITRRKSVCVLPNSMQYKDSCRRSKKIFESVCDSI